MSGTICTRCNKVRRLAAEPCDNPESPVGGAQACVYSYDPRDNERWREAKRAYDLIECGLVQNAVAWRITGPTPAANASLRYDVDRLIAAMKVEREAWEAAVDAKDVRGG